MTKLKELESDLAWHETCLAKNLNPEHAAHMLKMKNIDVNMLIPYQRDIVQSLKTEISLLKSKKKPKAIAKPKKEKV